jgi:phage-related tail fiber protein
MALAGIPISENECIGDSLQTINNALTSLDLLVSESGANVTVQETPPAGASPGDLWFDSSSGVLSIYYNDGNTSQWVVVVPGGDSAISLNAINSSTVDLSYNSSTKTLSATTSVTPVGSVMAFSSTSAPTGWLKLNGASLNRADYPALWAFAQASGNIVTDAVWTATNTGAFSTGNLTTTFRIPDLRGEFVRGWDDSRGVDTGRGVGVLQNDAAQIPSLTTSNGGAFLTFFVSTTRTGNFALNGVDAINSIEESVPTGNFSNNGLTSISRAFFSEAANETRPRNISLLYCIKF